MMNTVLLKRSGWRKGVAAGTLLLAGASAAFAQAEEASREELQAQVEKLTKQLYAAKKALNATEEKRVGALAEVSEAEAKASEAEGLQEQIVQYRVVQPIQVADGLTSDVGASFQIGELINKGNVNDGDDGTA